MHFHDQKGLKFSQILQAVIKNRTLILIPFIVHEISRKYWTF